MASEVLIGILAKGLIELGIKAIDKAGASGEMSEDEVRASINQTKNQLDALESRIIARRPKISVD